MTLALESCVASRDWCGANALLAERELEIAKLTPADKNGLEDILRLDQKLQENLEKHMQGLRSRMQSVAHVRRTARAFDSARGGRGHLDLAG